MSHSNILKVVVLGSTNVGKTSLMNKYVRKIFTNYTKETVGVDFLTKEVVVGQTVVTLQIWDTAGQERFQALCGSYYHGADCCVLVYNVTDRESFDRLDFWYNQFLNNAAPKNKDTFPFILIGNKVDLPFRQVTTVEAEEWCYSKNQCPYFETSAKDGINIDVAFEKIADMAARQIMQPTLYRPHDCHFPKPNPKRGSLLNFC